ncbi:MAG: RNA polymerase sigma factor [Myxococcaceae bacterium]
MDDAEAIARSLDGDPGEFRHLVERYEREAYAHALAITRCPELARDALQEALVDAWKGLTRFDRSRRFYPWLYTLLRHRCFKLLASRRPSEGAEALELIQAPPEFGEARRDLERALGALGPEDRELIVLKHLDGLTYAELGERLGVAPGTVMSRLFHARARLREKLGEPS